MASPIFNDLNNEQADGLACVRVRCKADFRTTGIRAVPVGESITGSQVFACADLCAAAVGYRPDDSEQLPLAADCIICGPGCCSPVLGVHTSCPGPQVGRTVESVR
jgi:hypothetical protein